jgi:carboxyl-terminal processing protease
VQRAIMVEPTVTLETDDGIAWLHVSSFNQRTGQSVAAELRRAHRLLGSGMRGIVLDLRGNPGGLLDQSVEVASLFLDGAAVTRTTGRNPESRQAFAAPTGKPAETAPMVVLINGGSASAAEIVAAALQDAHRAIIVGTASYGKGTVQTVLPMANDGEIAITWARLIAPRGYMLDHHGVVPNHCTALGAASSLHAAGLPFAAAASVEPDLDVAREGLDEAGWQALRRACPAERVPSGTDRQMARGVLGPSPGAPAITAPPAPIRSAEARAP